MKRDNHLISTDNKGYAAQRFESIYNQGAFPGQVSLEVKDNVPDGCPDGCIYRLCICYELRCSISGLYRV